MINYINVFKTQLRITTIKLDDYSLYVKISDLRRIFTMLIQFIYFMNQETKNFASQES
jgi:hypothetical protein